MGSAVDRALAMVLDRLNGVEPEGRDYVALCPAHDDHNPSLGVFVKGETICVKCRSQGCDTRAILKAIGFVPTDLRSPFQGKGDDVPRRVVDVYDYRDASGHLIGQVVRYEPKAFRHRPASVLDGGASWSVQGIVFPLYGLPALLTAKAEGREVWLVEGEKDTETAWREGLAATTTAGVLRKNGRRPGLSSSAASPG
jgi:hypothetical protein